MEIPPLDPDVADLAPNDPVLTSYDEEHLTCASWMPMALQQILAGKPSAPQIVACLRLKNRWL
jgi:hypothetical protein